MAEALHEISKVRVLIADLCARNATAELHFESPGDDCMTARVRLIEAKDNLIFCDQPQNLDRDVKMNAGKGMTVYVRSGDNPTL